MAETRPNSSTGTGKKSIRDSKSSVPTNPEIGTVDFQPGSFRSSYRAVKSFKKGERITSITIAYPGPKAYTTVQYGTEPHQHLELGCDLVYTNHSCSPNTAFEISASIPEADWAFVALAEIKAGEEFTFFYPSTEWEMDQPFECQCGSKNCLGVIKGAKYLSLEQLKEREHVTPHILELVRRRDVPTSRKALVKL